MSRMFLVAILCLIPSFVLANSVVCPKGYQPYSDRCITQSMADYISCIEASGGNRQSISEKISLFGIKKTNSGGGVAVGVPKIKSSATLILTKEMQDKFVNNVISEMYPNAMRECANVLKSGNNIRKGTPKKNSKLETVIQPPKEETAIQSPKEDFKVTFSASIEGLYTEMYRNKDLWIVVQPVNSPKYHPQPAKVLKLKNNKWMAVAYVGGSPTENIGEKFIIHLVSTTPDASQAFDSYVRKSNQGKFYPGMDSLPTGTEILDNVTVFRE